MEENRTRKDDALQESETSHAFSQSKDILFLAVVAEGPRLPAHQHVPPTHQSHSLPPIQRSLGAGGNTLAKLQNCKVKENIVKTSREKKQVAKKNRIKLAADFSSFLFEAIVVPCPPPSGDRGSPI